ncbi:chitinase [Xylariales sp. PMI_506]|nr:chitinase [Xylariales sp. PMI_506]
MFMFKFILFTALLLASSVVLADDPSSDPYYCSDSQPCTIGCCGTNNVCGLGPSYCAPGNCTNSCDAKSDCDPGWGAQWSAKESCPLNVCCSQYGFCGTTSEFCGDEKVTSPSCTGGNSAAQKIIGYYEGWSTTRACKGLNPEDLLFGAYTHLNYAFAFVDPSTFQIATMQDSDTEFMPRLTALKNYNPGLQVWISIGGWSMNDPDQPTAATFSTLAGSESAQQSFFASLLSFMGTYGFDGVDIDWEYPVAPERSGNPADFVNYVSFLKNLRGALGSNGHNYGLSITLPSSYWYMQNFDIKSLEQYVDWFNVMSYDLHGTWDSTDPYIGAVINAHTNLTEIDMTMDLLWRNSIDPNKVVMGIGFYGRSFTLSDPSCTSAGCPFSAGGNPGPCSASAGTLMFSEIEDIIANGATVTTDTTAAVKIVTWDNNQWVSYDDQDTLKQKVDYANSKCLGGVMVWAGSTDDGQGTAIQALAGATGKTSFSTSLLSRATTNADPGQCVWGECGASCPSGLVPVESSSSNAGPLGIEAGCATGSRYFCCPASNAPTCSWKGSPKFCGLLPGNRCSGSEIEVAASTDGCWTGHKSLCCSKTAADSDLASCEWEGAAPICSTKSALTVILGIISPPIASAFTFASYGCSGDFGYEQTTGKQGEGGQQSCSYNGGFKSYCCEQPVPWKNCNWKTGNTKWAEWEQVLFGPLTQVFQTFQTDCKTGCDVGQVTVATDGFACRSGTYSYYCCDDPNTPTAPSVPEVSLCPAPADLPGLNSDPDPETSDSNVHREVDIFDDECTLPSYIDSPTRRVRVRATRPHHLGFDTNYTANVGQIVRDVRREMAGSTATMGDGNLLEKRGARDVAMRLCGPQGQTASLWTQNYPGAPTVLRATGKAFTVAKQGVCAAIGITALTTLDKKVDWVTEHVLEKQEFRDAVEWMAKGSTPSGTALTAGTAQFTGVFDDTGIFNNIWPSVNFPSLVTVRGWSGTIADAFTGLLGRTTDAGLNHANYDNLQVCDADFNRYKEFIVAGVDFIGLNNWNGYTNHRDRLGILSDVVDTFAYRASSTVVTSYHTTYAAIGTLWGDFSRYAATQGITYDYASAWRQIVPDALNSQVSATRTLFNAYLTDELNFWTALQQNGGSLIYTPTEIQNAVTQLTSWQGNVNGLITLPVAQMTA